MKYIKISILLLALVSPAYAEDMNNLQLPAFDIMSGMQTEWVARKMVYNGHPMSIQNFVSNRNSKDVMNHFESKWKLKGLGQLKSRHVGNDLTVGFVNRGYSYSVQSRDVPGGSVGTLVVTRNRIFVQSEIKFPMPPDAHVISRIHGLDLGIRSETITLSSYRSASMNQQWYRSTLSRAGWSGQNTMTESRGTILEFQKGKELCQLTFIGKSPVRKHRSMVMIHWIKG